MDHDDFKFSNDDPGISAGGFIAALGSITLAILLAVHATSDPDAAGSPPVVVPLDAPFDPSPFILNALLVPAIDADAVPLRWVDPRPPSLCGPDAKVLIDSKPLVAGALVPAAAFTLDWYADACHPFGANGPRLDGAIRLRVFRESGEFGAFIEPSTLRVTFADDKSVPIRHGWTTIALGQPAGAHAESAHSTGD